MKKLLQSIACSSVLAAKAQVTTRLIKYCTFEDASLKDKLRTFYETNNVVCY